MLSGSAGLDPGHQDAAGGRIGVLAGPDGIFMVDAQYAQLTDKVVAAIRKISPGPIRFLANTHIHIDHTGGNANFAKMGATLFAREELREEMLHPPTPANGNPAPARDPAAVPVVTYGLGAPVKFHMNGEIVDLIPGSRGPYRRRYDDPVRECERDHDRRFLPELRVSLHRHRQWRLAEGRAGSARRHDEACRSRHEARPRPRHHHQPQRTSFPTAT